MNRLASSLRPAMILSGLALLAGCGADLAPQGGAVPDRYRVQRGPMEIQVVNNAEIKAGKETTIRSEVEGQNTVIFLIAEGKEVKEGDKLVELDSSGLVERRAKQEIDYARAEAGKTQAEKDYEIQLKQFDADMLAASNNLEIAKKSLEKFTGIGEQMGERQQETIAAESEITLAKSKLEVALEKYGWSEKLFAKGFVTKNELKKDELDRDAQETAVQLAINKRDLLVRYEHEITHLTLKQKYNDAELEVERVKAKGEAKLAQVLAEKRSRQAEWTLAKDRFENLVKQVKNCLITSPGPGIVVYSQLDNRGMSREFVAEGATVRERQALIVLPDTTRMVASLRIHEAEIDKVRVNMPALIKISSGNVAYNGFVRRVAPLPDSSSRWSNPDLKVFQAEVEIDMDSPGLKPGTSAEVAIQVSRIDQALKVPIQAVQRDLMVQYVWVDAQGQPRAVQVELGMSDKNFVEVKKGLDEGMVVFLAPPPGESPPKFPQPSVVGNGPSRTQAANAAHAPADASAQGNSQGNTQGNSQGNSQGNTQGHEQPASRPGDATSGEQQQRRRGGGGGNPQMQAAVTELIELLKQKRPELAPKLEGGGMNAFRALNDEEVKQAIEEDPELKQKRDAMRAMMPQGRGRQGGGRQIPPGGEAPRSEAGRDGR